MAEEGVREDMMPGRDHPGPSGTPWIIDYFYVAELTKKCDSEMLSRKNNKDGNVRECVCVLHKHLNSERTKPKWPARQCGTVNVVSWHVMCSCKLFQQGYFLLCKLVYLAEQQLK